MVYATRSCIFCYCFFCFCRRRVREQQKGCPIAVADLLVSEIVLSKNSKPCARLAGLSLVYAPRRYTGGRLLCSRRVAEKQNGRSVAVADILVSEPVLSNTCKTRSRLCVLESGVRSTALCRRTVVLRWLYCRAAERWPRGHVRSSCRSHGIRARSVRQIAAKRGDQE